MFFRKLRKELNHCVKLSQYVSESLKSISSFDMLGFFANEEIPRKTVKYGDLVIIHGHEFGSEEDTMSDIIVDKGMLTGYGVDIENVITPTICKQIQKKYVIIKNLITKEESQYYIGADYYQAINSNNYLYANIYRAR